MESVFPDSMMIINISASTNIVSLLAFNLAKGESQTVNRFCDYRQFTGYENDCLMDIHRLRQFFFNNSVFIPELLRNNFMIR